MDWKLFLIILIAALITYRVYFLNRATFSLKDGLNKIRSHELWLKEQGLSPEGKAMITIGNDQVDINYIRTEWSGRTAETINLVVRGRVGGVIVTFVNENVVRLTINGIDRKSPRLNTQVNFVLQSILQATRQAVNV